MNNKRNVIIALALAVALTVLLAAACIIALPEGPTPQTTRQPFLPAWPIVETDEPSRGIGILYDNCPGCGDNVDFLATFRVWDPQDLEQCQSPVPYCDPLVSGDPIGIACEYDARSTSFYGGTWQLSYVVKVIPDANWSITGLETYIYDDGDIATEPVTLTIRSGPTFITSTIQATSVITGGNISDNAGQVTCYYFGEWSPKATFSFSPTVSMTSGETYWVVFSTNDVNGYLMPIINGAAKVTGGCEGNEAIDCADDYATKPGWYDNIYEWVVKPTTTPTQFYSILAQELAIPLAFDNGGGGATATPTNTPTHTPTPTITPTPTETATAAPLFTATPTPTVTPTSADTAEPNWTETVVTLQTATPTTTASATPTSADPTPTLLPTSTPSYYFIEILSSQGSPAVDYNQRGGAGVDDEFVELRVFPAQTLTGWSMELGGCTYTFATDNYTGPIKVIWADQFRAGANVCPGFEHPGVAILRDQNGIIQDIRLYWTYGDGNSWRALHWTDPGGAWIPASPSPGRP